MQRLVVIVLFTLSLTFAGEIERREVGNLVLENVPEVSQALQERLFQYQNVRSASFRDWSPEGEAILISTRFAETGQLHMINQPLGMRKQITFFKEPVGGGSFSPDPKTNGFLKK